MLTCAVAGTCINNTSIMMFKKGSFEVGGTIYPVAIKVRNAHKFYCKCGNTCMYIAVVFLSKYTFNLIFS